MAYEKQFWEESYNHSSEEIRLEMENIKLRKYITSEREISQKARDENSQLRNSVKIKAIAFTEYIINQSWQIDTLEQKTHTLEEHYAIWIQYNNK